MMVDILPNKYKTILIDPPWLERGGGKIKRGADKHYKLMNTDDIIWTIKKCGLFNPDPDGCHMYLWVTNNFLKDGLKVMERLRFRYITNIVWVKDKFGLGQYFRGQHELCLFGRYGETLLPKVRNIPTVLFAERTKHSKKPEEMYKIIEKISYPPRLELFARTTREGWDSWGDEL